MQYKSLGKTGVLVPEIGLGTHRYTGGVGPLRRGIALGACLVDTAESYGTESAVGKALQGIRDRVLIATKVSPAHLRRGDVVEAAERSLKLLNTDFIDLYQLHHFNRAVPLAETLGAMESLVDSGKVRFVGVCNFTVSQLKRAQAALSKHAITTNQVDYSLITRNVEPGLFRYCREQGITIIAHSPLGRGLQNIKLRDRSGALPLLADATGKTEAQLAINWCTADEIVMTVPKGNSVDHVEENCGASGWRLSPEQIALIEGSVKPLRRRGPAEVALRRLGRRALTRLHLR